MFDVQEKELFGYQEQEEAEWQGRVQKILPLVQ
jgi:hypothetical protein